MPCSGMTMYWLGLIQRGLPYCGVQWHLVSWQVLAHLWRSFVWRAVACSGMVVAWLWLGLSCSGMSWHGVLCRFMACCAMEVHW